ncbi:hypothetical protein CICLE_v10017663mg, partial [Citrus x clementina]
KTATCGDELDENISFVKMTCSWISKFTSACLPKQENLLETHFSKAKHFLDLIILCLQPSYLKEFHLAGVKFKPAAAGSSKNLLDINFDQGILEIPFLSVFDNTERLYRNLLAFERIHGYIAYSSDYIIMISYLVNTPKDAEWLCQNEITGLGNTQTLAAIFRKLDKECVIDYLHFQYSGIVANLQAYSKSPWLKWKATLKQNYFKLPITLLKRYESS